VQQQRQQQEDAERLAAAVMKMQVDLAEIRVSQRRPEADRNAVAGREKAVRAEERALHKKRATLNSRLVFLLSLRDFKLSMFYRLRASMSLSPGPPSPGSNRHDQRSSSPDFVCRGLAHLEL
jgi:hypothetical protein